MIRIYSTIEIKYVLKLTVMNHYTLNIFITYNMYFHQIFQVGIKIVNLFGIDRSITASGTQCLVISKKMV